MMERTKIPNIAERDKKTNRVKQRNEKLVEGDHRCKDIQTQVYISFSNKDKHGPTNYITYSDPLN
jgi:hypothetical protein